MRGNGKIIQELEADFRGAGWNVIKVRLGRRLGRAARAGQAGLLLKRMEEAVDGDYQNYAVRNGAYIREHFFGKYPELLELVADLSDDNFRSYAAAATIRRKVYNAFKRAVETKGQPSVILAKTIKGYGLGEAGEGRNVTHQQKKLNEQEMRIFRRPFRDSDFARGRPHGLVFIARRRTARS